jgi:hypothetical protein
MDFYNKDHCKTKIYLFSSHHTSIQQNKDADNIIGFMDDILTTYSKEGCTVFFGIILYFYYYLN